MAFVNANLQTVTGTQFGRMINEAIAEMKAASARRAVYRNVVRQLNGMSDRDLADIGISRLVIRDVASKAAYGTV